LGLYATKIGVHTVMPTIEFLCPNGHKIRCDAEQAGQAARCTACGVRFRVPDPAELSGTGPKPLPEPEPDLNELFGTPTSPPKSAVRTNGSQMEFLCPNGHRLFGTFDLAGHPGECPECGSRFRIPTRAEMSQPDEPVFEPPVSGGNGHSDSTPEPPAHPKPHAPSSALAEQAWQEEVMPSTVWSIAAGNTLTNQPVAALFAKLWTTRPKGTRVEVQLRDGEAVVVEQFVAALSQTSHGVFGVRAADSTHTLITIPWDAMDRILVLGLLELPK
jgi:hypothetical protein